MTLTPKNWSEFQHYKTRSPPWIKLHRGLMHNFQFRRLPLDSRALAPVLWLLASEYKDGKITASLAEIAHHLHMTENEISDALKPLIAADFFNDDGNTLAARKQEPPPEERRGETESETESEERNRSRAKKRATNIETLPAIISDWPKDYKIQFWNAYPRKRAKQAALRALERIARKGLVEFGILMAAVAKIPTAEPRFIKHPATWLNGGCWEDEEMAGEQNANGRQFQNDDLSVTKASERFRERIEREGITGVAPRPSLLPQESGANIRMLPAGRSPKP